MAVSVKNSHCWRLLLILLETILCTEMGFFVLCLVFNDPSLEPLKQVIHFFLDFSSEGGYLMI